MDTDPTSATNQFLTFTVEGNEYCVPIMAVREINGWTPATRLPNTPAYMRGVINLRGNIVPIFDLRARFSGQLTLEDKMHVTIIIANENRNFGLLVDSVSDILAVSDDNIRPITGDQAMPGHDFISNLLMVEERIVALLNVESLFSLTDLQTEQKEIA